LTVLEQRREEEREIQCVEREGEVCDGVW